MTQDCFNSTACLQEQDVACGGHAFLINNDLFLKIKRIVLNVVRLNVVH